MEHNFIFFGSSDISVISLEKLKEKGFLPTLVITKPDSPQGRGLVVTPSPVKTWAENNNIEVLTPSSLNDPDLIEKLKIENCKFALLVSYGKIIPQSIIEIFPKGILNLHPSLLPKLRGPSPIEATILNDMKDEVGVTIMLLNEKMDEGPILNQKKIEVSNWPISKNTLYKLLSEVGADLLVDTIPKWIGGEIKEIPQDNSIATYCKIIEKKDGEINLEDDPRGNFLKFLAYEDWPGIFFYKEHAGKNIRVKITAAKFENATFTPVKVIPEGKKEMEYESFLRGLK